MSKIRIKNFGPIKEGYIEDEGWIDINKVTFFTGNQGSGKSTIAKLISSITWMEKALVRGDFTALELAKYNRFKKHCEYQNIKNYFKDDSHIEYRGDAYNISYIKGNVEVNKTNINAYSFPKIMYVPSERNFVSAVTNVRTLKGLPSTLYTFADEFINAIEKLKEELVLPINNVRFEYQKRNESSSIVGDGYKIMLSESSSGFQSLIPLFIVTKYLSESINAENNYKTKEMSIDEGKRIRKLLDEILNDADIPESLKRASIEALSSRFVYSSFINIVEEPEQNLFPTSQWEILKNLLEFNNSNVSNKLIITTHSPYIINYLTIAVYSDYLYRKIDGNQSLSAKLNTIFPKQSSVKMSDVNIFELDETKGSIKKLETSYDVPSDENYLNLMLRMGNKMFDSLLEIEEEI